MIIRTENSSGSIEIIDYGIYDDIPEVNLNDNNNTIKINSHFKYDGCYYYLESTGELTFVSAGDASGRLVIPKSITLNGKEHFVTRIGEMERYKVEDSYQPDKRRKPVVKNYVLQAGAFFGTKVTECVFPSSIRDFSGNIIYGSSIDKYDDYFSLLEDNACNCHLTKISFSEDGAGNLESIGAKVFSKCNLEMDCLRLPEGLRHIGDYAFSGVITKVKLPSTIETIGDYAFWNCNIKSLNLPEGLESVGRNFIDLTYCVEKIEFPSTIKRIPQMEWFCIERWQKVSNSLPELLVHNGRKNVTIDKITAKNCRIEYIDKGGTRVYVRKRIRNYCFRSKRPINFDELNKYYTNIVVGVSLFTFSFLSWLIICLLGSLGVFE